MAADINGLWLGTYWQESTPTRFEATFVQGGNSLTGRIMDDSNLGEAQIDGEVIGRSIRFTKRYLTNSHQVITYSGTLSEDADSIQGKWVIDRVHSGTWEAHRSGNDLMADLKDRIEKNVPATATATPTATATV